MLIGMVFVTGVWVLAGLAARADAVGNRGRPQRRVTIHHRSDQ
jgi:hypothetical protein